jgi:hypothetical protein
MASKNSFNTNLANIGFIMIVLGRLQSGVVNNGISGTVLDLLIINYVITLWFAYGRYFEDANWQERCFDLL